MTDQQQPIGQQHNEQPVEQRVDLAPLRTFLVTSVIEMAAGLQELHADIDERASDDEYRGEYFRVLAGLAGASTTLAILVGGKAQEFGTLSNQMQKLIMSEYDRLRSDN